MPVVVLSVAETRHATQLARVEMTLQGVRLKGFKQNINVRGTVAIIYVHFTGNRDGHCDVTQGVDTEAWRVDAGRCGHS